MASNLRVDTILPSTGTTLGIGTASGTINFLGNSNITTTGTISAASLSVTGSVNAASATITGNLGVGGVLTYEDVTNIDSVGIVTARSGIRVTSTTAGIAVGTNAMVSGRADNVLHLHKASGGTADGPTIYFTNQQTGVTANDGFTVGLNDTQSPYLWNRENTATRFGTNNAERLRIGPAGQIGLGGANYGTSGQFLQSQGASSAVQWASVSTDLQFAQWRVTTPFGGGNVDPITNWSQTDANATLTQSGGIFSFPSTGYWEIMMQMYGYKNTDNDNIELHIMTTTNNSSYTTRSWAYSHMNNDDGGNLYVSIRASLIFDVTNTSTHKIKFKTINNTVNWAADSGVNNSYAIFKRLAAT